MKTVYILAEASLFDREFNDDAPECLAEVYPTKEAAMEALRELVDERVYETYEGDDDREHRTDEVVAEILDGKEDVGEWEWSSSDGCFRWRIFESEI
jgi:hypothetical protein